MAKVLMAKVLMAKVLMARVFVATARLGKTAGLYHTPANTTNPTAINLHESCAHHSQFVMWA